VQTGAGWQTLARSTVMLGGTDDTHHGVGEGPSMLEYYLAIMLGRGQPGHVAFSELPKAPAQPAGEDRRRGRARRTQPSSPADHSQAPASAPADALLAAGSNGPATWDPCPCRQWGVCHEGRHGCPALVKELFPDLDRELDAWEIAHGWLYR
jgi:hypothetical protein